MANRKLGNLGNLRNMGSTTQLFLIFEFPILPYSKNRKLRLKNPRKEFPRSPKFPSPLSFPDFQENI